MIDVISLQSVRDDLVRLEMSFNGSGWQDAGMEKPSHLAFRKAWELIERTDAQELQPLRATPSAEGGVTVFFSFGDPKAYDGSIALLNDETAVALHSDADRITSAELHEPDLIAKSVRWLENTHRQERKDADGKE